MTVSAHLRYPVVRRVLASAAGAKTVTEFGAGRGAMASRFVAAGYDYLGFEPDPESFRAAEAAIADISTGVVLNAFPPEDPMRRSDVVVAFEVLEHIEHDQEELEAWARWVKPGGLLIVSVPAHQDRFGAADVAVGHHRRYERDGLIDLFERVGLVDVQVRSVGFPAGFVLEMLRNRLVKGEDLPIDERTAASGRRLQPARGAALLTASAAIPFHPVQRAFERTDLGTGYVAWAHRPIDR